jgi:hypothetical protein
MVKLEQDLAPTDRCNGKEQVKSRSMDRDNIIWRNKMGSRQRYNHRAILFNTQDTIEGVSGLGSIAELLRGEVLSVTRRTGATR